jgi:putative transposase
VVDLRAQVPFREIRRCLARAANERRLEVSHFSVQRDHIHLIAEAPDKGRLSGGIQQLASRIARSINRAVRRKGSLWADRYHRQDLTTPRQFRACVVYVLFNVRKHAPEDAIDHLDELDDRSSAAWFDGWEPRAGPLLERVRRLSGWGREHPPVSPARTWLATHGWRRLGAVRVDERPARR